MYSTDLVNEILMQEEKEVSKASAITVLEETCEGIKSVLLDAKERSKGTFFIEGPITDDTTNTLLRELLYASEQFDTIKIFINSPGGSVDSGLAIYDMLQSLSNRIEINMYVTGTAASMAALLLASGPKGHRFVLPHSTVMIHEPLVQGGIGGSTSSIQKKAETMLECRETVNKILAKHTGKSIEEINAATSFDNFMTAEEAIEFGLCDKIKSFF